MRTIRAATTIRTVSGIAGLFLPVGCQGGSSDMSGPGLQNNGSPGIVVSLRRTLGLMIS
jgi:hypothetical protein